MQEYSASIIDLVGERNVLHDQIGELHGSVQKETQKVTGLEEDLIQVLQQLQGVAKYASVCVLNYHILIIFASLFVKYCRIGGWAVITGYYRITI